MQDWWQHIANSGAAITASFMGAAIGVAIEFKRHTWVTAVLALVSGVFVAYFGTDPLVAMLGLPETSNNAVAAILGISGRNLISFWLSASKDPISLWDRIRGKK